MSVLDEMFFRDKEEKLPFHLFRFRNDEWEYWFSCSNLKEVGFWTAKCRYPVEYLGW